jgi:hypothetical protein
MKHDKPILSPFQDEINRLSDEQGYFEMYDDLPASVSWLNSIGTALGKKFTVTVKPMGNRWEMNYSRREVQTGPIDKIYTRRGVLGLLLNGIGRVAFGFMTPDTTKSARDSSASSRGRAQHFNRITFTHDVYLNRTRIISKRNTGRPSL